MKKSLSALINYINLLSALWLAFGLIYLNYSIGLIPYYFLFISFAIEIFTDKKSQGIKLTKEKYYFIAMFVFFMLAVISVPLEDTDKYVIFLLEKRLPILGFAIIGFLGVNRLYKLKYFLYTFIASSVFAILYLLFYRIGITEFIESSEKAALFTKMRITYVNGHMMFNFYMNLSVVSIWYLLRNRWNVLAWFNKFGLIASFALIESVLLMSEGRSGFTAGLLIILFITFYELYKFRKIFGIVFAVILPVIFIGVASQHKRMVEGVKKDPRYFLWQSGLDVVKESPIWGNGISDAQVKFDSKRTFRETEEFRLANVKAKHLDCHNKYIQTTMELGVMGLLLLLFLYAYPILIADNEMRMFNFLLVYLCAHQSVFDMFITGPFSAIFGLLALIMLGIKQETKKEVTPSTQLQ